MLAPGEANEKLDASLQGGLFHKEEKGHSVKHNQSKSDGFDLVFFKSILEKQKVVVFENLLSLGELFIVKEEPPPTREGDARSAASSAESRPTRSCRQ